MLSNLKKDLGVMLEVLKSYYVAHIGFFLAAAAAIANHVGALGSILHSPEKAQTVAGWCEIIGLMTAWAPKAIEHAQSITSGNS